MREAERRASQLLNRERASRGRGYGAPGPTCLSSKPLYTNFESNAYYALVYVNWNISVPGLTTLQRLCTCNQFYRCSEIHQAKKRTYLLSVEASTLVDIGDQQQANLLSSVIYDALGGFLHGGGSAGREHGNSMAVARTPISRRHCFWNLHLACASASDHYPVWKWTNGTSL